MRLLFLLLFACSLKAESLTLAVASNFARPAEEIVALFESASGHSVRVTTASTGKLYAQIVNGAPFDLLLAADAERPRLLEESGIGVQGTRATYAIGRLYLYSDHATFAGVDCEAALATLGKRRLAIANPLTAPYGKAAQETLEHLKVWKKLRPSLVRGENIAQTLQFVATENAKMGFVAKSQVEDPRFKLKGSLWEVPASMHGPVLQQAILLKPGHENSSAKKFLKYLQGPVAKNIIRAYGYRFLNE